MCFDEDIQPERIFADNVVFLRESQEEKWADPEVAEKAARDLSLDDWIHPSRDAACAAM